MTDDTVTTLVTPYLNQLFKNRSTDELRRQHAVAVIQNHLESKVEFEESGSHASQAMSWLWNDSEWQKVMAGQSTRKLSAWLNMKDVSISHAQVSRMLKWGQVTSAIHAHNVANDDNLDILDCHGDEPYARKLSVLLNEKLDGSDKLVVDAWQKTRNIYNTQGVPWPKATVQAVEEHRTPAMREDQERRRRKPVDVDVDTEFHAIHDLFNDLKDRNPAQARALLLVLNGIIEDEDEANDAARVEDQIAQKALLEKHVMKRFA